MDDEAKSRRELLRELNGLRGRISRLQRRGADPEQSPDIDSEELLPEDFFYELPQAPAPMKVGIDSTESIELKSIFTRDVTASGSFDFRRRQGSGLAFCSCAMRAGGKEQKARPDPSSSQWLISRRQETAYTALD